MNTTSAVDSDTLLFVFDVDGTLLDSRLDIAASTRSAVRALRAAGHRVALASARPPRSVAALSEELLGEVTEVISLNGAFVTNGADVLLEEPIAPAGAVAVVEKARAYGLEINVFSGWAWLAEGVGLGIEAEAEIVGFGPTLVDDLVPAARDAAHKILLIGPSETVERFRAWANAAGLEIQATRSKPTYCEVVSSRVSKSSAVLHLADRIGVPIERMVAFGDGENDLPMIEAAGVGIAMGNAMPQVMEAADFVTTSHDEDGIAHALTALGYLEGG